MPGLPRPHEIQPKRCEGAASGPAYLGYAAPRSDCDDKNVTRRNPPALQASWPDRTIPAVGALGFHQAVLIHSGLLGLVLAHLPVRCKPWPSEMSWVQPINNTDRRPIFGPPLVE